MKKGFTLVELLGIIIILALLVILATPPIIEKLKKSEGEIDRASFSLIESAVDLYIDNNANTYPNINGNTYCISLQQLVDDNKLKAPIMNVKSDKEIGLSTLVEVKLFNSNKKVKINNDCLEYREGDPSSPELATGMIPVIYDGTNWVKADITKKWYDYNAKEWANAVTVKSTKRNYLTAEAGEVILINDINTMWVWIPRYKYAITKGTEAREINIVFESKAIGKSTGDATGINYRTHPAFSFGENELNGFWVGKFEASGEISAPTIIPNKSALTNRTIKEMYDNSRAMENNNTYGFDTDVNIHMAKDSEWGGVAYLSHSKYGINGEIFNNPSDWLITGRSGTSVLQTSTQDNSGSASSTLYGYDGKQCNTKTGYECTGTSQSLYGMAASTTGNIYGVYDMSGGAKEYTMSVYRPISGEIGDNSGFGATTTDVNLPPPEYWDRYTGEVATACDSSICYGSALSETSGWYGAETSFVWNSYPWSVRSGVDMYYTSASPFSFSCSGGNYDGQRSFRIILLKP